MAKWDLPAPDAKGRMTEVGRVITAGGTPIYLLPVTTFPGHINNIYLIDHPRWPLLFDVGTTVGAAELTRRFAELRARWGVETTIPKLHAAIISHAHLDHFGHAPAIRQQEVPIWIHDLDFRVLANFQERLSLTSRNVGLFLERAGVSAKSVAQLIGLYRYEKTIFSDLTPDRRLQDGETIGDNWKVIHLPGHCPGLIGLIVDDVVLTGDHLLSRITPAQSPQSITPHVGLDNYLDSLVKLERAGGFDLALGGHDGPIVDVGKRIRETRAHHRQRLIDTFACCRSSRTIAEVSRALFGGQKSYGILLALLETGAHVEYLYERGHLVVDNLEAISESVSAAPRYLARDELELCDPRLSDQPG